MLFPAIAAAAALSTLSTVSAGPVQRREVGGVLICTGANATGACSYNIYNLTQCYQLNKPYLENVVTFAPDSEAFFCYPRMINCGEPCYGPTGCTIGPVNSTFPHRYNLTAIGWNTHFKSFDCFEYHQ